MWPLAKTLMTPELQEQLTQLSLQQESLSQEIVSLPLPKHITTIAGCDSAFVGDYITSVFVVFSWPELKQIEVTYHTALTTLPYVPGFLAFRELPNLLKAYSQLQHQPSVIMVDGQGILHPKQMGIATHLGIKLGIPTIGIAKKKLVGTHLPVADEVGSYQPVIFKQQTLAYVLRSRQGIKPIYVSPGHLCDLTSALNLTLSTLRGYKLPEPTRWADVYSKKCKKVA